MSNFPDPLMVHAGDSVRRMARHTRLLSKTVFTKHATPPQLIEEDAISAVLLAEQEVRESKTIRGDLRKVALPLS